MMYEATFIHTGIEGWLLPSRSITTKWRRNFSDYKVTSSLEWYTSSAIGERYNKPDLVINLLFFYFFIINSFFFQVGTMIIIKVPIHFSVRFIISLLLNVLTTTARMVFFFFFLFRWVVVLARGEIVGVGADEER